MPESKHPISADIDENTPGVLSCPCSLSAPASAPSSSSCIRPQFQPCRTARKCALVLTPPKPAPSPTPSHHGTPQTDYHLIRGDSCPEESSSLLEPKAAWAHSLPSDFSMEATPLSALRAAFANPTSITQNSSLCPPTSPTRLL